MSRRMISLSVVGPLLGTLVTLLFGWRMLIESARMGVQPRVLLWIGVLWPLGHALSAWVAGHWVTPTRAALASLGGLVLIVCAGTVSLLVDSFPIYLAVVICFGLGSGHYYLSLQLIAGHARLFRTLAWSLAIMMVGSGVGEAVGPLLCGYLGTDAVVAIASVAWGCVLVYVILVISARRMVGDQAESKPVHEISSTPALRNIGRVCATIGMLLFCGTVALLWPGLGVARGLTDVEISHGSAAAGAMMPVGALLWACLRRWMNRPWLLLCLALAEALAFVGLIMVQSVPLQLVALATLGLSFSGIMFHCVYYGNADPVDVPKSVGINEVCFGIGALTGPAAMGVLAWDSAESALPYYVGGLLMLCGVIASVIMWTRSTSVERRIEVDPEQAT